MQRAAVRTASPSPRGITLLEVLLASALSLTLIAAVYSALDQSWRLTYAGRIEMERNQLARAILRQMELDIRAVMFEAQAASTDTSSASDSSSSSTGSFTGVGNAGQSSGGSTSTTTTSTTTTSETEEAWTGSLGIRGTSTELWLDLSHVGRQLEFQLDATAMRVSDLQTVAYFLSSSLDNANLGDVNTAASPIAVQDLDGLGLYRSQGDRSILRSLNSSTSTGASTGATSNGAVLPGPARLISPEVAGVQFQYFDGLSWYTEWDSSSAAALPRAIEITLLFEPPPTVKGFLMSPAVAVGSDTYRMVIAVPVSNPMPPEESL